MNKSCKIWKHLQKRSQLFSTGADIQINQFNKVCILITTLVNSNLYISILESNRHPWVKEFKIEFLRTKEREGSRYLIGCRQMEHDLIGCRQMEHDLIGCRQMEHDLIGCIWLTSGIKPLLAVSVRVNVWLR